MSNPKAIAVIGTGNVGGTLGRRWAETGHSVRSAARKPGSAEVTELVKQSPNARALPVPEAVESSEVVVLATPWSSARAAVQGAGNLTGKVLLDCTNPLLDTLDGLEI